MTIAGYGYSLTEAPRFYTCVCTLKMGMAYTHMCYPIERTTIRARAANKLSETLHFCRSDTKKKGIGAGLL